MKKERILKRRAALFLVLESNNTITIVSCKLTNTSLLVCVVMQNVAVFEELQTLDYHDATLTLGFSSSDQNIINVLEVFRSADIFFGQLTTQTPTLNNVFLEII